MYIVYGPLSEKIFLIIINDYLIMEPLNGHKLTEFFFLLLYKRIIIQKPSENIQYYKIKYVIN